MVKLKLDVDTLCVQTFATSEVAGVRGTVQGNDGAVLVPSYIDKTFCTCPGLCQKTVVDPNLTAPVE